MQSVPFTPTESRLGDDGPEPTISCPFDPAKERRSMYELKRHGLPALYSHGMLNGGA